MIKPLLHRCNQALWSTGGSRLQEERMDDMNLSKEFKLRTAAYAIDKPIYIDVTEIPEDYNAKIIKELVVRTAIPEGTEMSAPYFSNMRIIEPAAPALHTAYRIIDDIQGIWTPEIFKLLSSILGEGAVRIGITAESLRVVMEDKEADLDELRIIIHRYSDIRDNLRALTAYGYTEAEAAEIMKLKALYDISGSITDIARDIMDENAEKILEGIR